jgi:hypothetical protein
MNTPAFKRFGRMFLKIARIALFTLASRPQHVYWPLLGSTTRK